MTREPIDDRKTIGTGGTIAIWLLACLNAAYWGWYVFGTNALHNTIVTERQFSRQTVNLFIPAIWLEAHIKHKDVAALVVEPGNNSMQHYYQCKGRTP